MSITLPRLPYTLDALEPHISRRTLAANYEHNHAAFVAKTRALIQRTPLESASIEDVVFSSAEQQDQSLFNASAQAWNHECYRRSTRAGDGGAARGAGPIERCLGSYRTFSQQFATVAVDQFGSGWAWLVFEHGRVRIIAKSDAQTPLPMPQVAPLSTIDVWEHAYHVDYQYRRLDYIAAFLRQLIDWDFANRNLDWQLAVRVPALAGD
jgi:Fe-Mn family superoxide dismutase